MNLLQLQENLAAARLKGANEETTEKAVAVANACQQARKYETAVACLNQVLPDVQNDAGLHAVMQTALGTAFWEKAQLKKSLIHFSAALKLFKETDDKPGVAIVLAIVGVTFWRKREWKKALEILKDALSYDKGKNAELRFASVHGAFDRSIATLQNRVQRGRDLQVPMKILQPLFASAALYLVTGNLDELQPCLNESVSLAEQLGEVDIVRAAAGIKQLGCLV